MSRCLEPAEDVTDEIAGRSTTDASVWFADWLRRRDLRAADLAAEHLADALEALAAELRGEATSELTARTRGLLLAAAVLADSAGGVRVGDLIASE